MILPASVSSICRETAERVSRLVPPKKISTFLTCWLTVGWEKFSFCAVRVKFLLSATSTKVRSSSNNLSHSPLYIDPIIAPFGPGIKSQCKIARRGLEFPGK